MKKLTDIIELREEVARLKGENKRLVRLTGRIMDLIDVLRAAQETAAGERLMNLPTRTHSDQAWMNRVAALEAANSELRATVERLENEPCLCCSGSANQPCQDGCRCCQRSDKA